MKLQELFLALVITSPILHTCSQLAHHDRMQPAAPSQALKELTEKKP